MPRPLSSSYELGEINEGNLEREAVLGRLTPQALLEKTKQTLLDNWRNTIPSDVSGRPLDHGGSAAALLGSATTGQINAQDDTGSVSVGPGGIYLTNKVFDRDKQNQLIQDRSKTWALNINPLFKSGSFSKGDFSIGGTLGENKSGYISKGPLRFDAGYGVVEPYYPDSRIAEPGSYQLQTGGREPWAKLSVNLGNNERDLPIPVDFAVENAVNTAIQRDLPEDLQPTQLEDTQTGKEYAEQFLKEYSKQNEDWWRP